MLQDPCIVRPCITCIKAIISIDFYHVDKYGVLFIVLWETNFIEIEINDKTFIHWNILTNVICKISAIPFGPTYYSISNFRHEFVKTTAVPFCGTTEVMHRLYLQPRVCITS